jgi:hypothetical protein
LLNARQALASLGSFPTEETPWSPQGEGPVERRLAAILAADVAGYSRLMGTDEEGTLERLEALRLPFVFEDLGEQQVKNIARPVRVYRVRTTLTHPAANAPGSNLPRIAGEVAERRRREAGEVAPRLSPSPDKPSIAVLRFVNMQGAAD